MRLSMGSSGKQKRYSISRKLWRSLRPVYYWPGQIGTHLVRLASARQSDIWYRITAPWLVGSSGSSNASRKPRPARWYQFRHKFTFEPEHVRYDIDHAIAAGDVKGLALIFAMGAGDYFFTTPLLAALRKKYPDLPIIAFATGNAGEVNSPLLPELLRANPDINEVRLYDGKQTRRYKNYDYGDALRQVPEKFLAMPVLYEHSPDTKHRVVSLFETFGLPVTNNPAPPLIHLPASPPLHVAALLEKIRNQCAQQGARGVVFLQVDARSSHYSYPYIDDLVKGLNDRDYYVLSASRLGSAPRMGHELDFKEFKIMDSIYMLKLLRDTFEDMRIVSVASVFWSVSAAFNIPNLGMQHFPDDAMHNYWYANISVITNREYQRLPKISKYLAGFHDYELDVRGLAVFAPDFVLGCFDRWVNEGNHKLRTVS